MQRLKPKQLTQKQQRELDRKQKAKREKANLKKSKQRSRLTEDMKELERDKDRVRRSRSRERKKEAEGARCTLMSCVPAVQTETLQTEMLPPGMTAEKKDPVAGYPKLSQVGLPPPLILNYIRGVPLPGKVSL